MSNDLALLSIEPPKKTQDKVQDKVQGTAKIKADNDGMLHFHKILESDFSDKHPKL